MRKDLNKVEEDKVFKFALYFVMTLSVVLTLVILSALVVGTYLLFTWAV